MEHLHLMVVHITALLSCSQLASLLSGDCVACVHAPSRAVHHWATGDTSGRADRVNPDLMTSSAGRCQAG